MGELEARIAREMEEDKSSLKNFQAFFFYPPLLIAIVTYAAIGREGWWRELPISFAGGLVAWIFIEYVMHRYLFHRPERKGHWWSFMPWAHGMHHVHPRYVPLILAPVWFSFPISILIFLALRLFITDWQIAIFLISGIWVGYMW